MSDTAMIAGGQIRSFVERIEQIESEIQDLNDGKKEVFAEAKGEGFDVKVIREIIKLRKQDKDERDEHHQARGGTHHRPHRLVQNSETVLKAMATVNSVPIPTPQRARKQLRPSAVSKMSRWRPEDCLRVWR